MNRAELVEALAKQTSTSKADSERWLSAFIETVTKNMRKKDGVKLVGFGTFATAKEAHVLDVIHKLAKQSKSQRVLFQYLDQA